MNIILRCRRSFSLVINALMILIFFNILTILQHLRERQGNQRQYLYPVLPVKSIRFVLALMITIFLFGFFTEFSMHRPVINPFRAPLNLSRVEVRAIIEVCAQFLNSSSVAIVVVWCILHTGHGIWISNGILFSLDGFSSSNMLEGHTR
ncbi:hypothetical protein SASPL_125817 [Salvia splendens]|uniref:Uncharacterized protein n=1 Tax=Salvia splendens TaxID=180675 RepID=A0A8X8XKP7_SALSN|nr:hypothetical protein SASPL_125817 [Salvia splendens]